MKLPFATQTYETLSILKNIAQLSLDEFGDLIAGARKKGKQAGIKKFDINNAILKARGKKK